MTDWELILLCWFIGGVSGFIVSYIMIRRWKR